MKTKPNKTAKEEIVEMIGIGNFDRPIYIRRWILNWRFPFLHRVVIVKKTTEWLKIMNKKWSDYLDLYESKQI